jgi:hypothetical protein
LKDSVLKVSGFEERPTVGRCNGVLNEIYRRSEDDVAFVVKSISLSVSVEQSQIENEVENLINLRHPCIAAPIGFVLPSRVRGVAGMEDCSIGLQQ